MSDRKPYRHRFPLSVIGYALWLYHRFPLSQRNVQELLHERGIYVSHETLRQWNIKFAPLLTEELRHREPRRGSRWNLDEMQILSANSSVGADYAHVSENPSPRARPRRNRSGGLPKGTVATRLRDAFQQLHRDESFQTLYSRRGPPAFSPWRLALVTVLQFMEQLSDRQAADAVRGRIDWKCAGLGIDGSWLPL